MTTRSSMKASILKDVYIKNLQASMQRKVQELFKLLCDDLETMDTIDLDKLRPILAQYGKDAELKSNIIQIISSYKLTEKMLKNEVVDKSYNVKFNEESFCQFVSGKEIKNVIYGKTLPEQKDEIEEFYKLYILMGGTMDGISKESLNKCITNTFKLYGDPEGYMKSTFNADLEKLNYNREAEDMIKTLGRYQDDKLTLEDFMNIMTCEFQSDFDEITFGDK